MGEVGETLERIPKGVPTGELLKHLPEKTDKQAELKRKLSEKIASIKKGSRENEREISSRKNFLLNTGLHGLLFSLIISDADFQSTNDMYREPFRIAERKVRKQIWDHIPESAKRAVLLKQETSPMRQKGGRK